MKSTKLVETTGGSKDNKRNKKAKSKQFTGKK